MDDRDRKKMKMDKEEDEKMEKLYTLLKNAREMRKHVISSMEKKRQEEERARIHRFPSFRTEGFIFKNKTETNNNENAAVNASTSAASKYGSKEEKEEAETNEHTSHHYLIFSNQRSITISPGVHVRWLHFIHRLWESFRYRPIASFKSSNVAGTFGIISPELSRTGKASTSSDVFMLEITCGRRPVLSRASSLSEMVLTDLVLDCWEDDILHVVDERVKHDDKYLEEVPMVLKFLDSVAQLPRDLFDIVKARENVAATEATASSAQPTSIATVTFTVISFVSYGR
ncbi:hypothetical protein Bca52824_012593 [Brassica carinata]|uniref:Uncharacterized protein n=1 Tax=Brassica carinata TaxID=52824 RepID=A0A8X7VZ82_BRACI|nr:hypothetical protein Bca52824_012593 [Brassica carinata]